MKSNYQKRTRNQGNSPGVDGLPCECFHAAYKIEVPFLTQLFNAISDVHCYPRLLSQSVIVSIYKSGNRLEPDYCRGISLLCITSTIFSAILARHFCTWLVTGKLCPEQAGFLPGHFTIDHNSFSMQ